MSVSAIDMLLVVKHVCLVPPSTYQMVGTEVVADFKKNQPSFNSLHLWDVWV